MKTSLHLPALGLSTKDIYENDEIAKAIMAFDGIEIGVEDGIDLAKRIRRQSLVNARPDFLGNITMLNAISSIENDSHTILANATERCVAASEAAANVGCEKIQVYALNNFPRKSRESEKAMLAHLKDSLQYFSSISSEFGVRLAFEPVVFSHKFPFEYIEEIIAEIGYGKVGLVLDTWHLWAMDISLETIAKLPQNAIAVVHISDAMPPKNKFHWSDLDRNQIPGKGVVPVRELIEAVRSTGYDDEWCFELVAKHKKTDIATLINQLSEEISSLLL